MNYLLKIYNRKEDVVFPGPHESFDGAFSSFKDATAAGYLVLRIARSQHGAEQPSQFTVWRRDGELLETGSKAFDGKAHHPEATA